MGQLNSALAMVLAKVHVVTEENEETVDPEAAEADGLDLRQEPVCCIVLRALQAGFVHPSCKLGLALQLVFNPGF